MVFAVIALFMIHNSLFISPVYADCSLTDPNPPGECPAGLNELESIVGNVISVVVGLGFVAMLVLIVTAGFKYLTSGGEPKAIQAANQTFSWALLGVVFMAVAWVILQLIARITGLPVTIFNTKTLF